MTELTHDGAAAVDRQYYWRLIDDDTPRGTKLQLINRRDGVAQYGPIHGRVCHFTHWAPLPVFKKD